MAEWRDPAAEGGHPLRIVHCFRSPVGGIFRHVRDLVAAQADAGHHVGIVCDSNTGGAREEELFAALTPALALGLHRISMQRYIGPGDLVAFPRLLFRMRALKPDIIHSHGAKGGFYGRTIGTLLRASGRRVTRIYCPHGGSLHYNADSREGRLFFAIERAMEAVTDGFVFVSEYESKAYRAKVGTPEKPWRVIPNGVREEEFDPVEAAPGSADFLYIGMMRDLKGPDVFIDALAWLRDRAGQAPTAEIVGDGADKPRYEGQVERLGLAATTRFHAAMPARQAFAMADTVVVPSRAESMPYIVLEAAAAARPLIATNVGGIGEIFGSEQDRLVGPGDVVALAKAMGDVLDDPQGAMRSAKTLRDIIRPRFSTTAMTRVMADFYHECGAALPAERPMNAELS